MVEARTDKDGRYAIRPFPADSDDLEVVVHPPEGSRCLILRKCGTAAGPLTLTDKERQELNVSPSVGVVVRGRVTEAGSGKPVAGARIQYRQRHKNNPFLREDSPTLFVEEGHTSSSASALETAISGADGRFQLAVAPGPGHLFVLGPTLDYVPVATTLRELDGGLPGAMRYYPHAVVPLDLKPNAQAPEVAAELRRGVTVRGKVVGLDGKPAARFIVLCRSYMPSGWHLWQAPNWLEGRNGTFELPGCDPDKPATAYFFDREHHAGATAVLAAHPKNGDGPTVRLEPCGHVEFQYVDRDGEPLPGGVRAPTFFQFDPGMFETLLGYPADNPFEANLFVWWGGKDLIPGAEYATRTRKKRADGRFDMVVHAVKAESGKTVRVRLVDDRKAPKFVDLVPQANQGLKDSFPGPSDGNDLAALKTGERRFPTLWGSGSGIDPWFNIGPQVIQLANKKLKGRWPQKVEGLKVSAKFDKLHVLHATAYSVADDTVIARYIVHYEDKSAETIDVVYGKDVRSWWYHDGDKEPTRGNVTWKGSNDAAKAAGSSLWLFLRTWRNPHPEKKVASIGLVSTLTEAAPFVVAMTVEKE
jgi:hypothetical protein